MMSKDIRRIVHRIVMTIGMVFLVIGVVLLTVTQKFIVGSCFLGTGGLLVLLCLLATISFCLKKKWRSEGVEVQSEAQVGSTVQTQTEIDPTQYEIPRYEDVIVCSPAIVWTATFNPGTEPEPPPYSELAKQWEDIGEIRLSHPSVLQISSDMDKIKSSGVIIEDKIPEPLTPPPTYNDAIKQSGNMFEL